METYFSSLTVRAHRVALSKFRTSSHQLKIETGRYQKLAEKERICPLCPGKNVENEQHFLIECSYFQEKGGRFFTLINKIDKQFELLDGNKKFIYLMTTNSSIILRKLGQFIFGSFKQRLKKIEQL